MTRSEAERRVIEAARKLVEHVQRVVGMNVPQQHRALQEALAELDAIPADDGWRPIESAPKDGTQQGRG